MEALQDGSNVKNNLFIRLIRLMEDLLKVTQEDDDIFPHMLSEFTLSITKRTKSLFNKNNIGKSSEYRSCFLLVILFFLLFGFWSVYIWLQLSN